MHRFSLIACSACAVSIIPACHSGPQADTPAAAPPADQSEQITSLEQSLEHYKKQLATANALLKTYQDHIIIIPPITIDSSNDVPFKGVFTDLGGQLKIDRPDPAPQSDEPR